MAVYILWLNQINLLNLGISSQPLSFLQYAFQFHLKLVLSVVTFFLFYAGEMPTHRLKPTQFFTQAHIGGVTSMLSHTPATLRALAAFAASWCPPGTLSLFRQGVLEHGVRLSTRLYFQNGQWTPLSPLTRKHGSQDDLPLLSPKATDLPATSRSVLGAVSAPEGIHTFSGSPERPT